MICRPFNEIVGPEPDPGGVRTASDVACCTLFGGLSLSVTRIVKFDIPVAVGVPPSRPVVGFRVNPGGRVPVAIDHE